MLAPCLLSTRMIQQQKGVIRLTWLRSGQVRHSGMHKCHVVAMCHGVDRRRKPNATGVWRSLPWPAWRQTSHKRIGQPPMLR